MAKYMKQVTGDPQHILEHLHNDILRSGMSVKQVEQQIIRLGGIETHIRTYDKYFMRSENRCGLMLVVQSDGSQVVVCAMGAGGGSGALFRFSWGAEDSFVSAVQESMRGMGY